MGSVGYTDEQNIYHEVATSDSLSRDAGNQLVRGTDGGMYVGMKYRAFSSEAEFEAAYKAHEIPPNTQFYVDGDFANSNNEYSTEETVCGRFLGKPLYRKVVEGVVPPTSKDLVTVNSPLIGNIPNNATVCRIDGILKYNENTWHQLPWIAYDTTLGIKGGVAIRIIEQGGIQCYNNIVVYNNKPITVIVEYTKNTD